MSSYAETFDRIVDGDFAEASPEDRARAVREVVQVGSIAAAAVAFQPLPLLDVVLISPIQVAMVQAIGRVYGHRLDRKAVIEILSTFGASLVAQNVVMAAAKLVPVAGWLAGMSMAYALTHAVGEVSDHYFRSGRGVPPERLREMFKKVYRERRSEKVAAHAGDTTLQQKLGQLRAAREAGLLTEEEYEAKKRDVLAAF